MFSTFKKLKKMGILGMNERNAEYILKYNPRKNYPLVDDKLKSKSLAIENGIAVPPLYHVISIEHDLVSLENILNLYEDFVIKPAKGSGGDGILVITGRRKGGFIKSTGEMITIEELEHHISNILSGVYSLGGVADQAIIEYRVKFDTVFEKISFQGVPDIRMIVFLGYPVMGMLRLPTRMSQGKANLHQGAIGVGLDISSGETLYGTWQNQVIDYHPDTGHEISNFKIPYFEEILKISASCYEIAGLGYFGVDLVLDKERGPLMLELNARPGLSIQIANQVGLKPRLKQIEKLKEKKLSIDERVKLAQIYFKADRT